MLVFLFVLLSSAGAMRARLVLLSSAGAMRARQFSSCTPVMAQWICQENVYKENLACVTELCNSPSMANYNGEGPHEYRDTCCELAQLAPAGTKAFQATTSLEISDAVMPMATNPVLQNHTSIACIVDAVVKAATIQYESFVQVCEGIMQDFRFLANATDAQEEGRQQEWEPVSKAGKQILEASKIPFDVDDVEEKLGAVYEKKDQYCSDQCHDTVEWLVTLFIGAEPTPVASLETLVTLESALLIPAIVPRMYVFRWADPDADYPIITAHSFIILRMRGLDDTEKVLMVQSDAMKYSAGLWVQKDSSLLPINARQAHAKYGKGRLIPLDEYIVALNNVVNTRSLSDFGLPTASGTIIVAQEFRELDCEVAITDNSIAHAMTLSKSQEQLRRKGFFTKEDFNELDLW